jgi:G:T/U-mismatch repair DNA glycosylase
MYTTLAKFHEETLPYNTYIPTVADKLILGTFPTRPSLRKYDFFYPNPSNKFWKILAQLAGTELRFIAGDAAVVERKAILDQLKLAISDIGYRIYRQNESSLDSNIFPIEFTNVFKLLDEHPEICTLILTSSTKGNSVLVWFKAYCELNDVELEIAKDNRVPWQTTIWIKRQVRVLVVYSTSGAAGKSEAELVDMYMEAIRGITVG